MTREEIYDSCLDKIGKSHCLLLEAATGLGKTKISIDLVNHLCDTVLKDKKVKVLLLVAKIVHKQTWRDEFEKWGGIKADVTIECYESLHKHIGDYYDIILMDEVHHIQSEARLNFLADVHFQNCMDIYMIGLSATIPLKLKKYFQYYYHTQIVSCDIIEAIEDEVLPEPEIILMPLSLDNVSATEDIEINKKARGPIKYGMYKDLWKYKRQKVHAILSCTQKQKFDYLETQIVWYKNKAISTGSEALRNIWLHMCNERLEFLANCKNNTVKDILSKLKKFRTITFCKTIEQSKILGKYCIHSKNKDADEIYNKFNKKELNHITAVNILNENANLVDCKYAIFANLSSSEVIIPQRLGRAMRHKKPTIIVPYYIASREQEIVESMFKDYNKEFIRTIHNINDIFN